MSAQSPIIHSIGTLAKLFGVPTHRITYIVRSRGIEPVGIAGNVRLFDEAAARWIAGELQRIEDDKGGIR